MGNRHRTCLVVCILLLSACIACSGSSDTGATIGASSAAAASPPDAPTDASPLASDAAFVIQATPRMLEALRAVTDSFVSREAIVVHFAPSPDSLATPGDALTRTDLLVFTAARWQRLPPDSTTWALPFAQFDSVTWSDSARASDARTLVLTIPPNAPNAMVAERFVRYLLTDGRASLRLSGLQMLPRLEVHGAAIPPGIRGLVDTVVPQPQAERRDSTASQ